MSKNELETRVADRRTDHGTLPVSLCLLVLSLIYMDANTVHHSDVMAQGTTGKVTGPFQRERHTLLALFLALLSGQPRFINHSVYWRVSMTPFLPRYSSAYLDGQMFLASLFGYQPRGTLNEKSARDSFPFRSKGPLPIRSTVQSTL